tara:strand:- start:511 stop:3039 length:2529 start_codon:yes stop_codon:yes gene_type:complete
MAVYNRQMFVNAPQQMKLNSRGTGITSGLVPMKPKRGLVNEPGSYAGEDKNDELMSIISTMMADQNMAQLQPYQETFEKLYKNVLPSGGSNFQRNAPALLDFFSRLAAAGQGGQPLTGGESGPFLDTLSRIATATPALANITPAPDMDEKAKQLAAQDTIGLFKDMVSAELTKKEDEGTVLGKGDKLVDSDGVTIATGGLDYELNEVDGNLIMSYQDPNNSDNIITKNVFKQIEINPDSKVIKLAPNEMAFYGGQTFYGKDTPNLIKSSSNQEIGYYDADNKYVVVKEAIPKEVEKEIIIPKGSILLNKDTEAVIYDNSQIEKEVTVPAGAVYLNKETNEVLFDNSKESESKKQLIKVPPGTTVIDNNGETVFTAPDTKDETKTIKVKSGDTVIDQKGNIIFEAPEEPEYINVPNNVRVVEMKDGVATTIVEAVDNTVKKDRSTEGERNVDAAFDGLLGQNKVNNPSVDFIKDSIPQLASVFDNMNMDTPFTDVDIDALKGAYKVLSLESDLRTEPTAQELGQIEEDRINLENQVTNINNTRDLYNANYVSGSAKLQDVNKAMPLIDESISGAFQQTRQNLATIFDTFPVLKNSKFYDVVNEFIGDDTNLASTETLSSINNLFTLLNAEFFKGNLNQQEINILQGSVPQLILSKTGQKLILDIAQDKALVDMLPKQLYDEFLASGKLEYNGKVIFEAEKDGQGRVSISDQSFAQNEIFKIVEQVKAESDGKFTDRINALSSVNSPYSIQGLENLPANRKVYTDTTTGTSYNIVEEFTSKDKNFGIMGYANEDGKFIKPDGSESTATFAPNSPVYGLKLYKNKDVQEYGQVKIKLFDLYAFRG